MSPHEIEVEIDRRAKLIRQLSEGDFGAIALGVVVTERLSMLAAVISDGEMDEEATRVCAESTDCSAHGGLS